MLMSTALMQTVPVTTQRVLAHTSDSVNVRIARETERRVLWYAHHATEIDARLAELDREWDVERVLEANAATVALTGVVLGTFADRRFYFLSAAVGVFLLQHAVQGWCPPLPLLRRLGVRTEREIDQERFALKALRGDFDAVAGGQPRDRAYAALDAAARR